MSKLHQTAQGLASLGRKGDTMLVHMTPREVAGLHGLAKLTGSGLTVNPATGLPEASILGSILPMLAGAAVEYLSAGTATPWVMAAEEAAAGAAAGAATGQRGWGLVGSGLGGIGGGNIVGSAANVGSVASSTPVSVSANQVGGMGTSAGLGGAAGASGAGSSAETAANLANNASGWVPETGAPIQTTALQESVTQPTASNLSATQLHGIQGAPVTNANLNATGVNPVTIGENMGPMKAMGTLAPLASAIMTPGHNVGPGNQARFISGGSYRPGQFNSNFGIAGQAGMRAAPMSGQGYTPGTLGSSYTFPSDVALNPDGSPATYTPSGGKAGGQVHGMAAGGVPQQTPNSTSIDPSTVNNPFGAPATTPESPMYDYYLRMAQQVPQSNSMATVQNGSYGGYSMGYDPSQQGYSDPTAGTVGTVGPNQALNNYLNQMSQEAPANFVNYAAPNPTPNLAPGTPPRAITQPQTPPPPGSGDQIPNGRGGPGGIGGLRAKGGAIHMAQGGISSIGHYSDGGQLLKGPGDGMSDSIPATIHGDEPKKAALADGEFVVPADVVSHLGNGSTDAGARKLYSMMDKIRQARTGKKDQAPAVKSDKYLPS